MICEFSEPLYHACMDFTEKLERLTAKENKSDLAKLAGLPATAISNYIARKYMPRADTALRIAKALGVPLSWMVDSSQGWPPPENPPKLGKLIQDAGDEELCNELSQRYIRYAKNALQSWERTRGMDWGKLITELNKMPAGEKRLPERVRIAANAVFESRARFNTVDFIVRAWQHRLKWMPSEFGDVMPDKVMAAYKELSENAELKRFYDAYLQRVGLDDSRTDLNLPSL